MNYSPLGMVRLRLSPWLVLLLLFATGCSVEKNTGASRFYHNLTSLYNIYFNGNESYRQGTEKVARSTKDNYTNILPVFDFQDENTPSFCASDMERAIQKASKVISLHSITARPVNKSKKPLTEKEKEFYNRKEYNMLLDDSYLLMGKARIYLHEYDKARTTLNYCINESLDPNVIAEARIWLAIINNLTSGYSESARLIKQFEESGFKNRSVNFLYHSALADLHIRTGKYNEAAEELQKAIDLSTGKRFKYRYTYLLAQLYEKAGNLGKASDTFLAVTKMNTPYEIEFNARINHAGVFDITSGNPQEVRRELVKMSKDSKNKEYLDQIYYALGNLSAREGNMDAAIENYRRSVGASLQNNSQKGRSYLALGQYYYENPGYMEAGKYYDSAAFFLDKSIPEYTDISNRSKNLSQLVRQLEVIEREDSLLMVAAMPPQERINLIYKIIEDVRAKETVAANPEYADRYNLGEFYENERRFMESSGNTEGKWYFYNQSALTFGRTEFIRRWGDRKLEDNWRRSVKVRTGMAMGSGEEESVAGGESTVLTDNKNPETYLKNVPLTDSMKVISNSRIASAYYEAGRIFYELFGDQQKAIETFDILLLRYPSHSRVPEALYRLIQIFRDTDPARSELYRQRLLGSFPESEPAHLLTDPGYLQRIENTVKEADREYEVCYNLFANERYDEALSSINIALKRKNNEHLIPRYMLLKAHIRGAMEGERSLMSELSSLVSAYPQSAEAKRAGEIMDHLRNTVPEIKAEEDILIAAEIYTVNKEARHLFAVIIENPLFNINQAVFDVINYNIDNYTNKNYKAEGKLIDKKYIIITVGSFITAVDAMDYYNSFNIRTIIRNPSNSRMTSFIISEENLAALMNDMDYGRYQLFFEKNYSGREPNK